eukprot:Seg162.3 transcript_id=Seg162.3/GoldUCD/mRNA.D3Y31 product="hypothetical protein" protein_id=Seg162.3/GoldUCD/D3Y31
MRKIEVSENETLPSANLSLPINESSTVWTAVPKTSKYQRILSAIVQQKTNNESRDVNKTNGPNQANLDSSASQQGSNRVLAMTIPLVLLGIFLTLVILCHKLDTALGKRNITPSRKKNKKSPRGFPMEQGVQDLNQDPNSLLLKQRNTEAMNKLGRINYGLCEDVGLPNRRCMCKLQRCAHCLGYEAKKLRWKDLAYHNRRRTIENLARKNASTQTWMSVHHKSKDIPRSSNQGAGLTRRPASLTLNRQYIVEPDSVFEIEVSSGPHFPSSASNYTDSRASDFLSSTRDVSRSFYYSATSAQCNSVLQDIYSAGPSTEIQRRQQNPKQRNLKEQFISKAQLLKRNEDWI